MYLTAVSALVVILCSASSLLSIMWTVPGSASAPSEHILQIECLIENLKFKKFHWHTLLNNTTTTRPTSNGGATIQSLTELKVFSCNAVNLTECVLTLPCAFAVDDKQGFKVTAEGKTIKEASYFACRRAFAILLSKNASAVVLRVVHWKETVEEIVASIVYIVEKDHQPLAVAVSRASRSSYTLPTIGEEHIREQEILQLLRDCLSSNRGSVDPTRFPRLCYGKLGLLLDSLLESSGVYVMDMLGFLGKLRSFIEAHSELKVRDNSASKGWSFEWSCAEVASDQSLAVEAVSESPAQAAPEQVYVESGAASSSNQAMRDDAAGKSTMSQPATYYFYLPKPSKPSSDYKNILTPLDNNKE